MTQKNFFRIAGGIFSAVAVLHGVRLLRGWAVLVGSHPVPMWVSWIGLVIAGWLAMTAWKLK